MHTHTTTYRLPPDPAPGLPYPGYTEAFKFPYGCKQLQVRQGRIDRELISMFMSMYSLSITEKSNYTFHK